MKRHARSVFIRFTWAIKTVLSTQYGKGATPDFERLTRFVDLLDSHVETEQACRLAKKLGTAHHEEGRDATAFPPPPAIKDDFRPYPRRIAKRDGEG